MSSTSQAAPHGPTTCPPVGSTAMSQAGSYRNRTPITPEALTNLIRRPLRTLLCALGTMIAVAAFRRDRRADRHRPRRGLLLVQRAAGDHRRVPGRNVREPDTDPAGGSRDSSDSTASPAAGLLWDIDRQQTPCRAPDPAQPTRPPRNPPLRSSFTAASPSALTAIGAKLQTGRFLRRRRQHPPTRWWRCFGAAAAQQLGITLHHR